MSDYYLNADNDGIGYEYCQGVEIENGKYSPYKAINMNMQEHRYPQKYIDDAISGKISEKEYTNTFSAYLAPSIILIILCPGVMYF